MWSSQRWLPGEPSAIRIQIAVDDEEAASDAQLNAANALVSAIDNLVTPDVEPLALRFPPDWPGAETVP